MPRTKVLAIILAGGRGRRNDHLANGRPWDLDRTYGGLQVLPPYQQRDGDDGGFSQGNADAIYRHRAFIRELDPELLLVLSADHVYKLDYNEVVERHRERWSDPESGCQKAGEKDLKDFLGAFRVHFQANS